MAKGDTINAPFPLFMEDFDRDIGHLTMAEQMCYMRALAHIWKHGFITADPVEFARLTIVNGGRKRFECVANVQRMCSERAANKHERAGGGVTFTHKRVGEDRQFVLDIREKERIRKQAQRSMSQGTKKMSRGSPTPPTPTPTPIKKEKEKEALRVFEKWNELALAGGFRSAQKLTDKRRTAINARIKDEGVDGVLKVMEIASASAFLREGRWFGFDWFLNPANFLKIVEGNYSGDNCKGNGAGDPYDHVKFMQKEQREREEAEQRLEAEQAEQRDRL